MSDALIAPRIGVGTLSPRNVGTQMPVEIAKALLATTREVGKLVKDQNNAHGKYAFVGIDTFYEKVASVAAGHGLSWNMSEDSLTIIEGAKAPMIRATYTFSLFHESGAALETFSRITIIHPIQGAQTVGSAVSYLDKIFMRQVFKLSTGEAGNDADETNPNAFDLDAPAPKPAAKPATQPAPTRANAAADFDLDMPAKPATKPAADLSLDGDDAAAKTEDLVEKVRSVTERMEDGKPVLKEPTSEAQAAMIAEVFIGFIPLCLTMKELKSFWIENTKALEALQRIDAATHEKVKATFTARKAVVEKESK